MTEPIAPHGGTLVQRFADADERRSWLARVTSLPQITLTRREISDLEMIAIGAFSPLEGFLGETDYESVVARMRLANGLPWTIPVTLAVTAAEERRYNPGSDVALVEEGGKPLAIFHLAEKYRPDKKREALEVYRTTEEAHPGVKAVYDQGEFYLGGKVTALDRPSDIEFQSHRLDPRQTRELFAAKSWRRIVAFQTRNPIHRAHEYLQKCALESCDGLLVHPLVGETKGDDIPAAVRMECYKVTAPGLLSGRPRRALGIAGQHAVCGPARSDLSRVDAQELRLHAFHRWPRPRGRRHVLRHVRRAPHLRRVLGGRDRHHAALLRAHLLVPALRGYGLDEDLPPFQGAPHRALRYQGPRNAFAGRAAADGVLAARGRGHPDPCHEAAVTFADTYRSLVEHLVTWAKGTAPHLTISKTRVVA